MKCPVDGTTLQMTERVGVEVDYCPECRGTWLDRGELDRILEHAGALRPRTRPPAVKTATMTSVAASRRSACRSCLTCSPVARTDSAHRPSREVRPTTSRRRIARSPRWQEPVLVQTRRSRLAGRSASLPHEQQTRERRFGQPDRREGSDAEYLVVAEAPVRRRLTAGLQPAQQPGDGTDR